MSDDRCGSSPTSRIHRSDDSAQHVASLRDVRRCLEQEPIERDPLALTEGIELDAGLPPPAVVVPHDSASKRNAVY
jgi:hypothetical protein